MRRTRTGARLVVYALVAMAAACRSRAEEPEAAVVVPHKSALVALIRSSELAPYWHPETPGRTPLRIVRNPLSSDRPAFDMFGVPVMWIDKAEAAAGTAFVEVEFQLQDGVLTLNLDYAVEGIRATAVFFPERSGGWKQSGQTRVVERSR